MIIDTHTLNVLYLSVLNLNNAGTPATFNNLVADSGLNRRDVSIYIDALYDMCYIDGHWEKIGDCWMRSYKVINYMDCY